MIGNEYNILEDKLDNNIILNYNNKDYTVYFGYGTHTDLLGYLKDKKRVPGGLIYPLIWLESHFITKGGFPYAESKMKFIFATNSNTDKVNRARNEESFVSNLDIVLNSFIRLLSSDNAKIINKDNMSVKRFFNYNTNTASHTPQIWDAITLECEIKFNYNC